jgi:hypothetical protein
MTTPDNYRAALAWTTEPNVSGRYLCLRNDTFSLYDVDFYQDPQMGIAGQWEATEVCSGNRAGCTVEKLQPAQWLLTSALLAAPEAVGVSDEELREMWLSGEWFNEGATFREFASIIRRYGTARAGAGGRASAGASPRL